MSEIKLPRLLQAAKEFNIGQETLIDYLVGKGFSKDDLKPSSKLTEHMYVALQQGFQNDKATKQKSDKVDLPKGVGNDAKKRKEDEAPKKEAIKEEDVPEVDQTQSEPEVVPEPEPTPIPVPEPELEVVVPEPEIIPEPQVEQTPVIEEVQESPKEIVEEMKEELVAEEVKQKEEDNNIRVATPEIEGPKILDKIDLSAIENSTRPKKGIAPKPKVETPKVEAPKVEAPKLEEKKIPQVEVPKPAPAPEEPEITNIKVEKIEGPKIIGKIQLPLDNETRPKREEKRKRKRIPLERKEVKPDTKTNTNTGGDNKRPFHGNSDHQKKSNFRDRKHPHHQKREEKQIDGKEIQDKIRETQAKLSASGGNKQRSMRAKSRRDKRNEAVEAAKDEAASHLLQVTEFISVSELANLMDVSFADVISKCMGLGIMVSINQRLDAEVIELVSGEFGFDVEFIDMEKQMEMEEEEDEDDSEDLEPRSPIVTIMGHVDHGKTSLLDYIRNANVVAGEAGGITQHIGAYRVTVPGEKEITFLDTPGHEAFTAMRARGAKVTDIAIIVVAADDAVMPQTREAISHAQAAGVPMIFAVNKIDKDGANPTKIYEQLSQMNILVEEWGGKYQCQELSAKKGLNIEKLLEKVLLEAELLDLKANPDREATGTIIEASLDKGRGYVATLLVENGTLKQGDLIVSGQYYGRVKAMFNERNKKQDDAGPSAPAVVLGLNGAPQAGEKFRVYEDEAEAKDVANRRAQILREQGIRTKKHITLDEIGRRLALGSFKELNIIIKGDVDGSVEALSDSLQKLSTEEIVVNVIHKGVGQINESDIVLAEASDAIVIAFNVRPSSQASKLADNAGIEIKMYSVIYNAIEEVKSAMEGMMEPTMKEKITANVEIREVFKFDKATVAGCVVLDGKIKRDHKVRIIRDGIVVYPVGENATAAELASLKRFKDDAKEVLSGMECGLTIKNYSDIKVGDVVEAYELEEIKRTL
ncbi:MAG TPA: translation initiation factor IF-2 [Niabella sp.]|nr:translation initiation factor IF-2 [Niabella sp.]HOZ96562.1 translation initiation factor IF-2 [Niabella sp.]HQW13257.1 translation initiation factor IF-2 [Niabella sp.]HQX18703.1 translation initiation factor IF-2 [Niabella sp.]HQX41843.1 translation initiation factor IF-2 [Niabella sp.]